MKHLFNKRKTITIEENQFEFKGLTTRDLFALLNDYPDFVRWLFAGVSFDDKEQFAKTIFSKFPDVFNLILSLTCTNLEKIVEEDLTLQEKIDIFDSIEATAGIEAIKTVCDLTFNDGVAETVKKWEKNLKVLMETFFETKQKVQTKKQEE